MPATPHKWAAVWGDYSRAADNIIDQGDWSAQKVVNAFALGCRCFSDPFYRQHRHELQPAVLIATSLWEHSIDWERSPELWKRQWADVLRHADVAVVIALSLIQGDWTECQMLSQTFLTAGYAEHREKYGVPK